MVKSFIDLIEFGLRGNKIDNLVDGWSFRVAEVSSNVYKIDGEDMQGHYVSNYGIDPEEVLKSCIRDAQRISMKKSLLDRIKTLISKSLK